MSDEQPGIELSDAITMVREQLLAAQAAARRNVAGHVLKFEVGTVSIEFTGEVRSTTSGGGGASFWVLTADARAERASGTTQKIVVELTPITPDGAPFRASRGADPPPTP